MKRFRKDRKKIRSWRGKTAAQVDDFITLICRLQEDVILSAQEELALTMGIYAMSDIREGLLGGSIAIDEVVEWTDEEILGHISML